MVREKRPLYQCLHLGEPRRCAISAGFVRVRSVKVGRIFCIRINACTRLWGSTRFGLRTYHVAGEQLDMAAKGAPLRDPGIEL
jgi:hypothetical protein